MTKTVIGFAVDAYAEGFPVDTDSGLTIWLLDNKDVTLLKSLATAVMLLIRGEFLH